MTRVSELDKGELISILEASKRLGISYITLLHRVKEGRTPPVKHIVRRGYLVDSLWMEEVKKATTEPKMKRYAKPKPHRKSLAIPITSELLIDTSSFLSQLEEKLRENEPRFGPLSYSVNYKLDVLLNTISDYNISGIDTSPDKISELIEQKRRVFNSLNEHVTTEDISEARKLLVFYTEIISHLSEIEGLQNA